MGEILINAVLLKTDKIIIIEIYYKLILTKTSKIICS